MGDVTRLLSRIRDGDRAAWDRLVPLVYDELRSVARRQVARERRGLTLTPTEIVNEVLIRMLGRENASWNDRVHFCAAAALAMRMYLIDHARRKARRPEGNRAPIVEITLRGKTSTWTADDILSLEQALDALRRVSERRCAVVEMLYFTDLTQKEVAAALGVSVTTVGRDWRIASAWLTWRLRD